MNDGDTKIMIPTLTISRGEINYNANRAVTNARIHKQHCNTEVKEKQNL